MTEEIYNTLQSVSNYKKRNFYISIDFDVVFKHHTDDSFYLFRGNSMHSVFYNQNLMTTYEIKHVSYDGIFPIIQHAKENIMPFLITKILPDTSAHLKIDQILSFNVSIIYEI